MHASCYNWVGDIVKQYDLAHRSTIEIGSCIINGSVRDHFTGAYVGVDVSPGNGVDRVGDSEQLDDPDAAWHVVVSTEMLEHVKRPWRAVGEMSRICQSDGHLILTARGFDQRGCWEPHGYPQDCYRYSDTSMRSLVEDAGFELRELVADEEGPGWFLHAVKP